MRRKSAALFWCEGLPALLSQRGGIRAEHRAIEQAKAAGAVDELHRQPRCANGQAQQHAVGSSNTALGLAWQTPSNCSAVSRLQAHQRFHGWREPPQPGPYQAYHCPCGGHGHSLLNWGAHVSGMTQDAFDSGDWQAVIQARLLDQGGAPLWGQSSQDRAEPTGPARPAAHPPPAPQPVCSANQMVVIGQR